jgi:hypothetical protein
VGVLVKPWKRVSKNVRRVSGTTDKSLNIRTAMERVKVRGTAVGLAGKPMEACY